jgi:hypothetical protein
MRLLTAPIPSLALCSALTLAACSPAPPPTSPSPATSASAPSGPVGAAGWESGPWARFHSLRHDAWLTLPDGPHWRIDDHTAEWLVATHAATASRLEVRLFRQNGPVNREKCEAAARASNPKLPEDDPKTRVDSRRDDVVPGWDGYEFASVTPKKDAQGALVLQGDVFAVAARIHACFAVHYVTTKSGAGAEETIASRLADVSELIRKTTFEDEREGPGRVPPPVSH